MNIDFLRNAIKNQTEVAKILGIHQSYLNKMLNKKRTMPLHIVKKICAHLDIPYYIVLEDNELNQKIIAHLPHAKDDDKKMILRFLLLARNTSRKSLRFNPHLNPLLK